MGRNKTQPKIEAFLKELTELCNKHNMIVDANGSSGSDARFRDGCPLALYVKSDTSNNYRKVGYLWYAFMGDGESLFYNFDPLASLPYKQVITEDC